MARRKPKVTTSTFGFCLTGNHKQCIREFYRYYFDPVAKKMVKTEELIKCVCSKRGCKCFVRKADRK